MGKCEKKIACLSESESQGSSDFKWGSSASDSPDPRCRLSLAADCSVMSAAGESSSDSGVCTAPAQSAALRGAAAALCVHSDS